MWNPSSLKIFKWNLSSQKKKKSKFNFPITRLSKNWVLHLKLNFLKIEFQNRDISINSFKHEIFCWKVCVKGVKPHFGLDICISLNWTLTKFESRIILNQLSQTLWIRLSSNGLTNISKTTSWSKQQYVRIWFLFHTQLHH